MDRRLALALCLSVFAALAGCSAGVPASDSNGGSGFAGSSGTSTPADDGLAVTVVRVVDGDTMEVRYENGTADTVRLLGVDTPEVHARNSPDEFEGVPETAAGERVRARDPTAGE